MPDFSEKIITTDTNNIISLIINKDQLSTTINMTPEQLAKYNKKKNCDIVKSLDVDSDDDRVCGGKFTASSDSMIAFSSMSNRDFQAYIDMLRGGRRF